MKRYHFLIKSMEGLIERIGQVFEESAGKEIEITLWVSEKMSEFIEDRVKGYMDEHFKEIGTLKELGTKFSYHPDTITRKFKKKFGITPYKYLLQLKMEYAMHLLNEGYLIKQIADVVGFSSSNYFAQKLRKYVNRNKSRK